MTNIEKLASEYSKSPLNEDLKLEIANLYTTTEKVQRIEEIAFLAGYQAAIEHLSKQTEFRTCTIVGEHCNGGSGRIGYVTEVLKDHSFDLKENEEIIFVEIAALAASQAKVAELEISADKDYFKIDVQQGEIEILKAELTAKTAEVEELVETLDDCLEVMKYYKEKAGYNVTGIIEQVSKLLTKHAKGKI